MVKFDTGAVRDTGGKGRCDLLPHSALLRVSLQMENSLEHHQERNWEKGMPMHCFLDSALRHLFKYMDGWNNEDHLAAATTNLLMALWTEEHLPNMQDIPSRISSNCVENCAHTHAYFSEATKHTSETFETYNTSLCPSGFEKTDGKHERASRENISV